jgi:hypothetical protein
MPTSNFRHPKLISLVEPYDERPGMEKLDRKGGTGHRFDRRGISRFLLILFRIPSKVSNVFSNPCGFLLAWCLLRHGDGLGDCSRADRGSTVCSTAAALGGTRGPGRQRAVPDVERRRGGATAGAAPAPGDPAQPAIGQRPQSVRSAPPSATFSRWAAYPFSLPPRFTSRRPPPRRGPPTR